MKTESTLLGASSLDALRDGLVLNGDAPSLWQRMVGWLSPARKSATSHAFSSPSSSTSTSSGSSSSSAPIEELYDSRRLRDVCEAMAQWVDAAEREPSERVQLLSTLTARFRHASVAWPWWAKEERRCYCWLTKSSREPAITLRTRAEAQLPLPMAGDASATSAVSRDEAVLRLSVLQHELSTAIQRLDERVREYTAKAVAAKKGGDTRRALTQLKTARVLREAREQKEALQHQLEVALERVTATALTAHVVSALKEAAGTLKATQEATPIEEVEEVMQQLQEAVEDTREVDRVLAEPLDSAHDDDELERELASLVQDELAAQGKERARLKDKEQEKEDAQMRLLLEELNALDIGPAPPKKPATAATIEAGKSKDGVTSAQLH